ncbi:hypothetical protein PIB30_073921 [Stylosanthes scabra]|uniref:Uncharacterized protein n=1 Tax=Stylosanthes scabra TaxID=79078 RepID=A0ABU6XS25_9FABA|nr:hypothetical protein [Stylosanthes scabra]
MKKPTSAGTSRIQTSPNIAANSHVSRVGDGETIRLMLGKSYRNASRLYIPIHFASVFLIRGLNSVWSVTGPNSQKNNHFRFKFVKHASQRKAKLKKTCELKIVSMSKKLIEAEVISQDEMIKKAIRSDLNRHFVSTRALWPTEKERTMIFQLCRYHDIQEFPKEFFQLYKNVFNRYIHLIDVMDNCLKLRICDNKERMWLPTKSVSLILKFYNHGYGFNLGLKSRVGYGETIQLNLGKTYPKASRVYIPCNFAKLLLPAGVDIVWTVVGPSRPGNNRFRFKFVRKKLQQNAYLFTEGRRDFCTAYKSKLKKPCLLKIVSVQNKLIEASFQD